MNGNQPILRAGQCGDVSLTPEILRDFVARNQGTWYDEKLQAVCANVVFDKDGNGTIVKPQTIEGEVVG